MLLVKMTRHGGARIRGEVRTPGAVIEAPAGVEAGTKDVAAQAGQAGVSLVTMRADKRLRHRMLSAVTCEVGGVGR